MKNYTENKQTTRFSKDSSDEFTKGIDNLINELGCDDNNRSDKSEHDILSDISSQLGGFLDDGDISGNLGSDSSGDDSTDDKGNISGDLGGNYGSDQEQSCGSSEPTVICISDSTAVEGQKEVFDVQLSDPATNSTKVKLELTDGTAILGQDYKNIFEVSFDDGLTWKTVEGDEVTVEPGKRDFKVRLDTIDDAIVEGRECFTITASSNGGSATGTGKIKDNDLAVQPKVVCISDSIAVEGEKEVFDVRLSDPATNSTKVKLELTDGTAILGQDYKNIFEVSFDGGSTWKSVAGNEVTVESGKSDFKVRLDTIDDAVVEGQESFKITASSNGGSATGTGKIKDNDVAIEPKLVCISDATAQEGEKEVFDVQLSGPATSFTKVTLDLADGTAVLGKDYQNVFEVSFDGGSTWQPVTGKDVTVQPGKTDFKVRLNTVDDNIVEPTETFTISATANGSTVTGTGTILDNDVLPEPKLVCISNASATEGDKEVFDVQLSGPATSFTKVTLDLTDGTAVLGKDYQNVFEVSFDGGSTWQPVTGKDVTVQPGKTDFKVRLNTVDDNIVEPTETFTISATANGSTVTGTGTILDNDVLPEPKLVCISNASATEGDKEVFDVQLSGPATSFTKVTLDLTDGTAVLGKDYQNVFEVSFDGGSTWQPVTGKDVTVQPGKTDFKVRLNTVDDNIVEPTETFTISATANGSTVTGTGTILDNDVLPEPKLVSISNASATEGDKEVFDVKLSDPATDKTKVTLDLTDGTAVLGKDYQNVFEVSFDGGSTWQPVTGKDVTVQAGKTDFKVRLNTVDDNIVEPTETFTISATANGSTVTGTGTILDNDVLPEPKLVCISNASATEGDKEVFDVQLSGPATSFTKVTLDLTDGTAVLGKDYQNVFEVSFDGGSTWQPVTGKDVTVQPGKTDFKVRLNTVDDNIVEPTETFTISATANGSTVTGTGTILDNDVLPEPKLVSISNASATEGDKEVFDVKLSDPATDKTKVTLDLTDGTAVLGKDYQNVFEVSFDGGSTWQPVTGKDVTVQAGKTDFKVRLNTVDDNIVEPTETFTISATANGSTVTGTGTILDNDVLPEPKLVSISNASATEGDKEVFDVKLSDPATDKTKVTLDLTDGTALLGKDYQNVFEVSFDGGSTWQPVTGKDVTVQAGKTDFKVRLNTVDDNIVEPTETFTISATANGSTVTGTGTILDNDVLPEPKLVSISNASATEGDKEVFDVKLSDPATDKTKVTLDLTDGTAVLGKDYQNAFEVSFDGGTTWQPVTGKDVTVQPGKTDFKVRLNTVDDNIVEPTETFKITATANGSTVTGTGTILDNDVQQPIKATLVGNTSIDEGASGTYCIQLDQVSTVDRFFTIQIDDGTAKRIDADASTVLGNATMSAYTGNPQSTVGNQQIAKYYDKWGDSFWKNENLASKGYQVEDNKDFTVFKNGTFNTGNTITVKVAAGQSKSETFNINAWKENIIAPWALAPNTLGANEKLYQYYGQENAYLGTGLNSPEFKQIKEGNENFSLKVTNAGDVTVDKGSLDVTINDKSNILYISPIAIDLNGDGIKTVSADQGVKFDILNTGTAVGTGWISGQDGFLAVDANGNGQIDDRHELFGGGVGEGFAELSTFDTNGDGVVDAKDEKFGTLSIWQDANENGVTDAGELKSLAAAGISSLNVAHNDVFTKDAQGNILGEHSSAITNDGKSVDMIDVYFKLQ